MASTKSYLPNGALHHGVGQAQQAVSGPVTVERPYPISLSVHDMIQLAQAGIKVELHSTVQPYVPEPAHLDAMDAPTEILRMRMETNWSARRGDANNNRYHPMFLPLMRATRHEDNYYIFIHAYNHEPRMFIDPAAIFPSDALVANINLMMDFGDKK